MFYQKFVKRGRISFCLFEAGYFSPGIHGPQFTHNSPVSSSLWPLNKIRDHKDFMVVFLNESSVSTKHPSMFDQDGSN